MAGRYRSALIVVAFAIGFAVYLRRFVPPSGAEARTLSSGGLDRSYVLYTGNTAKKSGLVLVLHGLHGNGVEIERRTNRTFDRLADREGFVVVYPDAEGGRWNEGWPRTDGPLGRGDEIDDVGFLSALIDSVCKEFDVDPRRVYATGLSNGASMVYRLACERENKVAAIAPVAGGIADPVAKRCKDGRPVPLLVIHGTSDAIVPYEMAVPKNLAQWMQRDVCPTPPEIAYLPDVDENDGTRTRLEHHRQCKDDSEISLYVIEGGGHRWPGDDTVKPFAHLGRYSRDFDAASVIWDFFKRHRLP